MHMLNVFRITYAAIAIVLVIGSPVYAGENLVLPLKVNMVSATEFVKLGFGYDYGKGFQSTIFLTPEISTEQIEPLIRLVPHYNNFDGNRVANAIAKFRGKVSRVQFGREGSPVIYIQLPYWTHQRESAPLSMKGVRINERENDLLVSELRAVFVGELQADEFGPEPTDKRRLRIWWD